MKKRIFAALALLLALCFAFGCGRKKDDLIYFESVESTQAQTSLQTTSETTALQTETETKEQNKTYNKLKRGDESEEVKTLQKRLNELGYLSETPTGKFGEETEKAVRAFQKSAHLGVTGVADDATLKKLYGDAAKKQSATSQTTANAGSKSKPLAGKIIGIDAGHQAKGNSQQEPNAPGSGVKKAKVTSGTTGKWTKTPEHVVNLQVALLLRDMLEEKGAKVVMVRETANVNISNAERAKMFNNAKTDFAIRIHCNGSDNSSDHGAFMLVPTKNPNLSDCNRGAKLVIDNVCKETGAKNLGIRKVSDQTGFNWCERTVVLIEMGHMSNKDEDYKLSDPSYQKKMARGMANGIEAFFENK